MASEKRMAGNYEITHSIHIGDTELVLGENMNASDGEYYLVADYNSNDIIGRYSRVLVSSDFLDVATIFADRLKENIERLKKNERTMPKSFITADMCESIDDKDLQGEIIVIAPDVLRPEYRTQTHQIALCTGGNGARYNALGTAVYCDYLYDEKHTRFERYDVLGILKKEHYPEWLTQKLEFEKAVKENHNVFEYGGYHFLPVGVMSKQQSENWHSCVASDKSLGIWSKSYTDIYGENKIDYTHKGFYDACNNIPCDIFKCLENGKLYIPAENELFGYSGKYKDYEEKPRMKSKKDKEMER